MGIHFNNRRHFFVVVVGSGMSIALARSPAAQRVYSLEDCLRIGLERAAPIVNAHREEARAETQIGQVRARILPDLRARGEYRRADEVSRIEFGGASMPMGRLDNYSASLEASQLIYDGGSVQAALRAAKALRDRAAYATRRAEAERRRDIRLAFHAVLFAREAVAVEEARVAQFERFARDVEARFARDASSEFDLLAARVRLANARPALIDAQHELRIAKARLRDTARLDEQDFDIQDEWMTIPRPPPLETVMRLARQRRPEIEEQRKVLTLVEADRRVEQGGAWPALRARAGYAGQNPPDFVSANDEWRWSWNAGLTLEWALFDGAARRNRIREKTLAIADAEETLEELKRVVALQAEEAWLRLLSALEAEETARANIALAERALEIARARFNAELATALEFIESNVSATVARLNWSGARRAAMDAQALLEWACGGLLEDAPQGPPP